MISGFTNQKSYHSIHLVFWLFLLGLFRPLFVQFISEVDWDFKRFLFFESSVHFDRYVEFWHCFPNIYLVMNIYILILFQNLTIWSANISSNISVCVKSTSDKNKKVVSLFCRFLLLSLSLEEIWANVLLTRKSIGRSMFFFVSIVFKLFS